MRIGSNYSGIDLIVQHNLAQSLKDMNLAQVRLSTMRRINTGADDPAGLIAMENLLSDLTAVQEAMEVNLSSAVSQIADADVAQETSRLVRSRILADAGVSLLKTATRDPAPLGVLHGLA